VGYGEAGSFDISKVIKAQNWFRDALESEHLDRRESPAQRTHGEIRKQ
jgi:hypothetical protein